MADPEDNISRARTDWFCGTGTGAGGRNRSALAVVSAWSMSGTRRLNGDW